MRRSSARARRRGCALLALTWTVLHRSGAGLALAAIAVTAAFAAVQPESGAAPTVVEVDTGALAGETRDGVSAFLGIPYAAAPTGVKRWKPPEPAPAWSGVRPATAFGPVCPQPIEPWAKGETGRQSEACLSLNVWAPATARPSAGLPVMLWIHGGGYTAGAGSQSTYLGQDLARRGVVVVTINYRLGVLGFLAHPELSRESAHHTSGDYGLLDQIEALRWTRRNIARFGGDPANVTIFGESAGGGSVLLLTASPLARGLFSKAIVESGAALDLPADGVARPTLAQAEAAGRAFSDGLGAARLDDLRLRPVSDLLAGPASSLSTRPIVDGVVVPTDITLAYRAGRAGGTPLLIGWNSAEGDSLSQAKRTADYESAVRSAAGSAAKAVLALYPVPAPDKLPAVAARELSDTTFGWRAWSVAQAQSTVGGAPVFVYHFDNAPPRPSDSPFVTPGTLHSEELGFVWGGAEPARWPAADRRLADQVQRYWTNFARSGDPNGAGLPDWRPHRPESSTALWFQAGQARSRATPDVAAFRALDGALSGARAVRP